MNNRFKEAYDRVEMADTLRESVLDHHAYVNLESLTNREKTNNNQVHLLNKERL